MRTGYRFESSYNDFYDGVQAAWSARSAGAFAVTGALVICRLTESRRLRRLP